MDIEKHIKRVTMTAENEGFLEQKELDQKKLWEALNNELSLGIPKEHFSAINPSQGLSAAEAGDTVLCLCYNFGSNQKSFEKSFEMIQAINLMIWRMQPWKSFRRNQIWNPKKPNEFFSRHEDDVDPGFFWAGLSNGNSVHTTISATIQWIEKQSIYYIPSFEVLQMIILYPELIKFLNPFHAGCATILGMKTKGLSSTSGVGKMPSEVECVATIGTNAYNHINDLTGLELRHTAETTSLHPDNRVKYQCIIARKILEHE